MIAIMKKSTTLILLKESDFISFHFNQNRQCANTLCEVKIKLQYSQRHASAFDANLVHHNIYSYIGYQFEKPSTCKRN